MWVLIGILLVIFEVFSGTFYLLFVGFAALLTAIFSYFSGSSHWALEGGLFAVLSLASAFFVKTKRLALSQTKSFKIDEKTVFVASEDLDPGEIKMIQYQGVPWSAQNISDSPIRKGQQVRIRQMESIRLLVEPMEEK